MIRRMTKADGLRIKEQGGESLGTVGGNPTRWEYVSKAGSQ